MFYSLCEVELKLRQEMELVASNLGISSLPCELLARIFSFSYADVSTSRCILSLVCRRFRDIIADNQAFWTDIGNDMDEEIVDLYLTRSKNAAITIELQVEENRPHECITFLRKAVAHCARWSSFRFLVYDTIQDRETMVQIHRLLSGLSLPALKSVDVMYFSPEVYAIVGTPASRELHFYSTWYAPTLETFKCKSILPVENESFRLTEITVDNSMQDVWNLAELGQYLVRQTMLQDLHVYFAFQDGWNEDEIIPVQLKSVHKLTIKASASSLVATSQVLKAFGMPALETLELHVDCIHTNLEHFFPEERDFSTVKELLVRFRGSAPPHAPMTTIFGHFPNLEDLTISSPDNMLNPSVANGTKPPPLRRIFFEECNHIEIEEEGMPNLLEHLKAGPTWSALEELHLSSPSGLRCSEGQTPRDDMDSILATFLPQDKVFIERR